MQLAQQQPSLNKYCSDQKMSSWEIVAGRTFQSLRSRYIKVLRPRILERKGRLPRRTRQPTPESTTDEEGQEEYDEGEDTEEDEEEDEDEETEEETQEETEEEREEETEEDEEVQEEEDNKQDDGFHLYLSESSGEN